MKRGSLVEIFRLRASMIFIGLLLLIAGWQASCGKMGKPDDAAITIGIKAKMFSEPALKAANVDVSSRGGEVTLTGQVPDDSARLAAYKIASEAKGVTKVNDQMTVLAAQAAAPAAPADSAAPASEAKPAEPAAARKTPPRRAPRPKPSTETAGAAAGAGAVTSTDSAPPSTAQPAMAATPAAPPPPEPRTVTVPSGSIITVRT